MSSRGELPPRGRRVRLLAQVGALQSTVDRRNYDVEFTSDLLLLVRSGVQATNQDALDRAYKEFDAELPDADICARRFHDILSLIDAIFEEGTRIRRLRTKMSGVFLVCGPSTGAPLRRSRER